MIPNNDGLQVDFDFVELPTNTYYLHILKESVSGFTDRLQAMAQAIFLILNIERYDNLIYSWNYGIELADLFGMPVPFCVPEIKRRVTEALLQDSRITGVDGFVFSHVRKVISARFTAHTVYGDVDAERVVQV